MKHKICHSGGAEGSDLYFEHIALKYGCDVIHYSYKTPQHNSMYKYELSEQEFKEGLVMVERVAEQLKRFKYKAHAKYLARNYFQVKNSNQVFAVSQVLIDETGALCRVKGGTGWAIQMGINIGKEIFVFDQNVLKWFLWDYSKSKFTETIDPIIEHPSFAGIGTRKLNMFGMQAIDELFQRSFKKGL